MRLNNAKILRDDAERFCSKKNCSRPRATGTFVLAIALSGCSEIGPQYAEYLSNQTRYSYTEETGVPAEFLQLGILHGEWETRASFINPNDFEGGWATTSTQSAECVPILGGTFIQCEMNTLFPQGFTWRTSAIYSFDRYQSIHRIAFMDDQWALLDVYEGRLQNNILKADNKNSKTFGPGGLGGEFIPAGFELSLGDNQDYFTFSWMSDFGGATYWRPVIKIEFMRKGADTSAR